jgi:hypothetical protein
MLNLGIVASSHVADSAMTLAFNTRTYDERLTTSSTSTNTISLTAGSEGDLAVLIDYRVNSTSTSVPPFFNPSGWAFKSGGSYNTETEHRYMVTTKVLTASDAASGTVTNGQAENHYSTILFFTPTLPITNVQGYDTEFEGTSGDASLQVQNVTTVASVAPVIVLGFKATFGTGNSATFTTPTWDADFAEQILGSEVNHIELNHRLGYIIQNTTLADVSVDANDEGAAQILASNHISVS